MAAKTDERVSNHSAEKSTDQRSLDQQVPRNRPATQVSEVNNLLRSEQLHSYYEEQGMTELGSMDDGQNLLGPPPAHGDDQFGVPYHFDEEDARPLGATPIVSNQGDSAQLDAMLKPYEHLMGGSDIHPTQRFLTPGAPQDPTYHSKVALDELGTPYADGSSNENRAKIAELNYLDVIRGREKHHGSSSNGFDCAEKNELV